MVRLAASLPTVHRRTTSRRQWLMETQGRINRVRPVRRQLVGVQWLVRPNIDAQLLVVGSAARARILIVLAA